MGQEVSGSSRKLARKQARKEKNQRKAESYFKHKSANNRLQCKPWSSVHSIPESKIMVNKIASKLPKLSGKNAMNDKKVKRVAKEDPYTLNLPVYEDPILAFAERALERGVLHSDGEFDENEMNDLFSENQNSCFKHKETSLKVSKEKYSYRTTTKNDLTTQAHSNATYKVTRPTKNDPKKEDSEYSNLTGRGGLPTNSIPIPKGSEVEINVKLQRTVQGLVNKLTISNFDNIAASLLREFDSNPRHAVTETICNTILSYLRTQPNLLESFIMTYAALSAAIGHLNGVDFLACILEKTVNIIDTEKVLARQVSELGENSTETAPEKVVINCAMFLGYLYNLQMVSSSIILELVNESTSESSELDVEIIVRLIRTCGAQIRRDDPASLKNVITKVLSRASEIPEESQSSRFKFMVETIHDLKNNRQKLVVIQQGELDSVKKVIRNLLLGSNQSKHEPLRVGLGDIRNVKTKGKWWKIGAAWNPDGLESKMNNKVESFEKVNSSEEGAKLIDIAKKQRMNTDVRRNIFATIVTSEDFIDAHQRLLMLKLPSRQEREIVHVLLHCCTHEKSYNPFYALLAGKFLETRHGFVVTFKYSLWDFLSQLESDEEVKLRKQVSIAKFYGFLLSENLLPLNILKKVRFEQLSQPILFFLQILFVSFFESAQDNLKVSIAISTLNDRPMGETRGKSQPEDDMFGSDNESNAGEQKYDDSSMALKIQELASLKSGIRIFLKQFIRNNDSLPIISNHELFTKRVDLALSILE